MIYFARQWTLSVSLKISLFWFIPIFLSLRVLTQRFSKYRSRCILFDKFHTSIIPIQLLFFLFAGNTSLLYIEQCASFLIRSSSFKIYHSFNLSLIKATAWVQNSFLFIRYWFSPQLSALNRFLIDTPSVRCCLSWEETWRKLTFKMFEKKIIAMTTEVEY